MKRTLLICLCIVLPLLAFAGNHSILTKLFDGSLPGNPARGFRISERIISHMEMDAWQLDTKYKHWYPNSLANNPDSLVMFTYNSDTSQWDQNMVIYYHYNAAGRVVSTEVFVTFAPGVVFPMISSSSIYDTQNRLTHFYMSMLDGDTFTLVPYARFHFNYSGPGLASIYGWTRVDLEREDPYWKSTFESDAQGRVVLEYEQTSPDSSAWVNSSRTQTTYHPNDTSDANTLVEYISKVYPSSFGEGMYDYPGMPLNYTESNWDGAAWVIDNRRVHSWQDGTNHLISIQDDSYQATQWIPQNLTAFSYNNNGNISLVMKSYMDIDTWVEEEKEEIFWQSSSSVDDPGVPMVSELKLSAYPMPFNDVVNINPQSSKAGVIDVNIYNLKGQQIQAYQTLPGQNIAWNGTDKNGKTCASGIFFVKAKQNGAEAVTRIIKLK
ncbi:MAG: hypothetical protein CVU50_05440 [Candidatus Cloacimonetes bacterium HGW-Cloacimonetes-3]|jgi:hypothetical protein|nr:MAG: hypothetical protein CVU50_05440 [Candidatus Cloacimonetes bacterium HGW-Cloacimonetes-3]